GAGFGGIQTAQRGAVDPAAPAGGAALSGAQHRACTGQALLAVLVPRPRGSRLPDCRPHRSTSVLAPRACSSSFPLAPRFEWVFELYAGVLMCSSLLVQYFERLCESRWRGVTEESCSAGRIASGFHGVWS